MCFSFEKLIGVMHKQFIKFMQTFKRPYFIKALFHFIGQQVMLSTRF